MALLERQDEVQVPKLVIHQLSTCLASRSDLNEKSSFLLTRAARNPVITLTSSWCR